jgi:ubiquinol-cytochrome c reductase cytochrome b subunit
MAETDTHLPPRVERWLGRWTTIQDIERSIVDEPSSGFSAWTRTTAGVVVMLLAVQLITGLLLAFYYVPSAESAHTTVSFIEKVLPAGSWIRALHHYGSQWLTLAIVIHLAQMFWRATYRRRPVGWMAAVVLLMLVLAGGATGYSLPWDARAFFGTRVAEGIAGGTPLVGDLARRWLIGGTDITPVTLARFYALHVLVTPALILLTLTARLFIFRERALVTEQEERRLERWMRGQMARNAIIAGLVFLALALYAYWNYAPLGPPADTAAPGYLPRPGAQFRWLFQLLKYLPGRAASVVALALPTLIFAGLASLPLLNPPRLRRMVAHPRRIAGTVLFALGFALFTIMTALSYYKDAHDPVIRAQLARQSAEEAAFRGASFVPLLMRTSESAIDDPASTGNKNSNENARPATGNSNTVSNADTSPQKVISPTSPPESYIAKCSGCHGTRGQGVKIYPRLIGISAKPNRTVEDIIAIMNNPQAYGLDPLMPSFADKLTEDEKREIAEWAASLKKR